FGEAVKIEGRGLVVVEGSYTLHPDLGHYYDLALFLCVSPEEQRKRLRKRSPELLSRFETEWIPKENAYAKKFSIRERCHFAWESESLLWE
ncbi:MAG: hypothetical protein IKB84_03815, partial [Clostridia bacterium]|nr:hypothetical protein [Clostridia bacterium]